MSPPALLTLKQVGLASVCRHPTRREVSRPVLCLSADGCVLVRAFRAAQRKLTEAQTD